MLLRNYDNIMTAKRRLSTNGLSSALERMSTDTTVFGDGHINVKKTDGTISEIYSYYYWGHNPLVGFCENSIDDMSLSYGASNLICGAGDTDSSGKYGVSYDDYSLAIPLTSSQVKPASPSQQTSDPIYDEANNSWNFNYSRLLRAMEDIVIKEIGVYSGIYWTSHYSNKASILVYRKVLDTPIEVPKDANFLLSFNTTVSANPNKPVSYDANASLIE